MSQQKADYADDTEIDETLDETADDATVEETVANLEERGFDVIVVDDTDEALDAVQSQIPAGASVMNGHSTTLEEIGFDNLLGEGDHEWESLPDQIWSIDDDAERQTARRESQTADYFLGGINAIARTGELVAADLSGSRIGAYPFAAGNVVIVTGTNKVVPTLSDALDRLESSRTRWRTSAHRRRTASSRRSQSSSSTAARPRKAGRRSSSCANGSGTEPGTRSAVSAATRRAFSPPVFTAGDEPEGSTQAERNDQSHPPDVTGLEPRPDVLVRSVHCARLVSFESLPIGSLTASLSLGGSVHGPGGIRTPDRPVKSRTLSLTELPAQTRIRRMRPRINV